MAEIGVARLDDPKDLAGVQAAFRRDCPSLHLSTVHVDGPTTLRAEYGGMRVFWVYRGQGEVWLPRGYRTQEGDGAPLPPEYQPDPAAPELVERLEVLKQGMASVVASAREPVRAMLSRWRGGGFVGEVAGDLWKLEHLPRPWSNEPAVQSALEWFFGSYRRYGYSTKQSDSYEAIQAGDQLVACGQEALRVRGRFDCLAMENPGRRSSHVSAARRLRYLLDTAGGCNPHFDPFRRLPLTWQFDGQAGAGDGLNWVNSHVVNIPQETSPTHFHPVRPVGGGQAQIEMYLVLDPAVYRLHTSGRQAWLIALPDVRDLGRYQQVALEPGMFVYIPPGTGHRGLDVFVNVLTIPGFKPHNELYLDRDVQERAGGNTPYNETLVGMKNFERLEDYFQEGPLGEGARSRAAAAPEPGCP